jgi:hypothetical protein
VVDADVLRAASTRIRRVCAVQGLGLTIRESPITISRELDGVLYSEGFNRDTFQMTLDSVNVCVERIHALIPGGHNTRPASSGYVCRTLAGTTGRSH